MSLDTYKFRCSSLGKLMTNARSKSETLSETTKSHLLECWIEYQYGRKKEIDSKYLEKGKAQEAESMTLYSLVKRQFFKKNNERLTNPWITGEPDLFIGKDIVEAEKIIDLKTSWSLHTFMDAKFSPIEKDYMYQLQGYMALTGAKEAALVYCLVDTPDELIADEKRRLAYKMGVIDEQHNPEYIAACREIDKNSYFGDIPQIDRVFERDIKRDDKIIESIYSRVDECRKWIAETFYSNEVLTEQLEKSIAV